MFPQHSNKSSKYCNLYISLLGLQSHSIFFFCVVWKVKGIADRKPELRSWPWTRQTHNNVLGKHYFVCSSCPNLCPAQRMAGFLAFEHLHLSLLAPSVSLLKVSLRDLHVGSAYFLYLVNVCVTLCIPVLGPCACFRHRILPARILLSKPRRGSEMDLGQPQLFLFQFPLQGVLG